MPFRNRTEAGGRLAERLRHFAGESVAVYALPRGGVPVAAPIAATLGAPLDLILVRKIGVPYQPELAMGAVADGTHPTVVTNDDVLAMANVNDVEFSAVCKRELAEIERRRKLYLGDRPRVEARGRVAIVVDDGIATGATTRAALRAIRAQSPKKLVLATPVAPSDTIEALRDETDDIVCLEAYADFGAIGFYYADFRQIEDKEVIDLLDRFGAKGGA